MGGLLDLARTEHPARITAKEQRQQHLRRNLFAALCGLVRVNPAHIQLGNEVHDEARQMVGWKRFAQADHRI